MGLFPDMVRVRQLFPHERVENLERELLVQLRGAQLMLPAGASVAIAVGSRGVANLGLLVRTVAGFLRTQGYLPFIVPAMGSHGGATAEGQAAVLAGYGITEEAVGAPVRSSMETVELSSEGVGNRVFMDRLAYEADATILVNRVKPHTDFHGSHESGLLKMACIGLGKKSQAEEIHNYGVQGLKNRILPTALRVLASGKIALGVAVVENAYDETMVLRVVHPGSFEAVEKELLETARSALPTLPTESLDILLLDEMGKEISGVGMDTNVIGRIRIPGESDPAAPRIGSVVVCDLTAASHGNAIGIGLADVATRRLFEKIDFRATYENVITSSFYERGKIPMLAENPADAAGMALRSCGLGPREAGAARARIVRIRNTARLDELMVSPSVATELQESSRIEMLRAWQPLFDEAGELTPWG